MNDEKKDDKIARRRPLASPSGGADGSSEAGGLGRGRSMSLRKALAALGEEPGTGAVDGGDSGQKSGSAASNAVAGNDGSGHEPKEAAGRQDGDKAMSERKQQAGAATGGSSDDGKTRIFGGSEKDLKFHQEPVVGWLVVVAGPGLGAYRPIYMGSNTIGSDPGQRIPIDFGDEFISRQEQAYIRYDADDRQFLFIPNLAKANVVSVDDVKPTSAVRLMPYDIIAMGNTKLAFVPFCGEQFDWSDISGS